MIHNWESQVFGTIIITCKAYLTNSCVKQKVLPFNITTILIIIMDDNNLPWLMSGWT